MRIAVKEEKIRQLIEEILEDERYNEFFLLNINAPEQGRLIQVFLDGDNGISFVTCQSLSRELEKTLDTADWVPRGYVLEVSSPGAQKPLIMLRQFPQHIGRVLKITLDTGEKVIGKLERIEDNILFLEEEKTIKQGKSRKKITVKTEIDFNTIKETKVKISFKK